jgi:hypothetical protein
MILYIFNLYIPAEQAGRQKTLDRMLASTPQISPLLISCVCIFIVIVWLWDVPVSI